VPEPGPLDVLVRLNATGLCYTDLHFMKGDLNTPTPMTVRSPGHEGAGVVVKVGSEVKNWKVGDRAGIKPILDTCGACDLCWNDKEAYCNEVVTTGLDATGTYQQYVVSPARYTTRIPDGVDDFIAGPIMCSASTIIRSIEESGLQPGQWAVFSGAGGGVGIQGIQLARAMGLRPIAIDGGSKKRDLCLSLGAEAYVDFLETKDVAGEVVKIADGIGAHGVYVSAGAPAAYKDAIALVGHRIGAKIMCIGLPPAGTVNFGSDPATFVFLNLSISGNLVASMKDTERALDFAKRGLLKGIYEKYPIDKLPEALERLKKGDVPGRIVVDFNA